MPVWRYRNGRFSLLPRFKYLITPYTGAQIVLKLTYSVSPTLHFYPIYLTNIRDAIFHIRKNIYIWILMTKLFIFILFPLFQGSLIYGTFLSYSFKMAIKKTKRCYLRQIKNHDQAISNFLCPFWCGGRNKNSLPGAILNSLLVYPHKCLGFIDLFSLV